MLAIDISAANCLLSWVDGVLSHAGTFVANKNATWDTTPGAEVVPDGWTVIK
jgi:hypothetical protein